MVPTKIPDKQYVLSLDNLDLSFLGQYIEKTPEERKLLWSVPFIIGDSGYCEVELVTSELEDEDYCLELYETYLCDLCNTEVPQTCYSQHIKSKKHQCYKILTEKVLQNVTRQIKSNIDFNMKNADNADYADRDSYFCEICSKLVSVKYQLEHNRSSCHLKSIEKEELANNFLLMYTETECKKSDNNIYSTRDTNENHPDYKNVLNMNKSCSNDNLVERINNTTDIPFLNESLEEEFVSTSSACNESFQSSYDESMNFELYLKNMIAKYKLSFNIPIIKNNCIVIVTPKGYKEIITIDNFHGYMKYDNSVFCRVCHMDLDLDVEQHSATEKHVRQITQPINDYFIRKLVNSSAFIPDDVFSHCLICNEIVISSSSHALMNINHKKYNYMNMLETPEIPTKSKITFCDVCNVNINIALSDLMTHINGKKHRSNAELRKMSVLRPKVNLINHPLREPLKPESPEPVIEAKKLSNKDIIKMANMAFSEACQKTVRCHNLESYINSQEHKNMLNAEGVITPEIQLPQDLGSKDVDIISNFCYTFQVNVPKGGMFIHVAGRPHRYNLQMNHKKESSQIPSETILSITSSVIPTPSAKRKRKRTRPKKNKTGTVEEKITEKNAAII